MYEKLDKVEDVPVGRGDVEIVYIDGGQARMLK
jgi:hypothetical protein